MHLRELLEVNMSYPIKKLKLEPNSKTGMTKTLFYPVLPEEFIKAVPLMKVYIDTIVDPKNISKVIVELNSIFPLTQLTHLKRIKGRDILLLPLSQETRPDLVHEILRKKHFDTSYLQNNVKSVSVAQIPPKTRSQYEVVHKLWPCNFHSNKYVEKLCTNTLFSQTQVEDHINYMRIAIDVAKFSKCPTKALGVVVVDPNINSIVAVGFDKRIDNPCQHAVMVAIDNVALTQNGGAWQHNSNVNQEEGLNLIGIPSSVLSCLQEKYENIKFGATTFKAKGELEAPGDGPYLCTGYYVYSTREPCVMCAMALIHSRSKRVFYGIKSENGGLGSLCKIHAIIDLNHHYEVFGGLLENECALL